MEISKARLVRSPVHDPWKNLAWEEYLSKTCSDGEAVLFLWQNESSVIIGRNQNAWSECRLDAMKKDSVPLARRSTGGGAVYHDLGNLNFTFILPRERYSMKRQLNIILKSLASLGVKAEFTGRNDLTIDGRKFSGNAYLLNRDIGLHHGTLLVDSDMEILPKYLKVDKEKLKSKGVKSVASRVINLKEAASDLSVEKLIEPLKKTFLDEYKINSALQDDKLPDDGLFIELYETHKSHRWLFGRSPLCEISIKHRFGWGGVEMNFDVEKGAVKNLKVFSDAMDSDFIESAEKILDSSPFDWDFMAEKLEEKLSFDQKVQDLVQWFFGHPSY